MKLDFETLADDMMDEALELQRHLVDKYGLQWAKFYASAGSWTSTKGWGLHLHLQCELLPYMKLWQTYKPEGFVLKPTRKWSCENFEESLIHYEEFKGKNFQKYVKKEIKAIKAMPDDTPSLIEEVFGVRVVRDQFVVDGSMLCVHTRLPRIGFIQYEPLTDMSALTLLKAMRAFAAKLGLMDMEKQHGCQFNLYWKEPRDPEFRKYNVRAYIAFQGDDFWRMLPKNLRTEWLANIEENPSEYVEVD